MNTLEKLKEEAKMSVGVKAAYDAVRERDKHACQICGRQRREGERQLDVHHLNENDEGKGKPSKVINDISQMVTICRKCHMNLPVVREKMSKGKN